jgi:hypothetical protein
MFYSGKTGKGFRQPLFFPFLSTPCLDLGQQLLRPTQEIPWQVRGETEPRHKRRPALALTLANLTT